MAACVAQKMTGADWVGAGVVPRAWRGSGLTEQGEDGARALVGDRESLNAKLLLGLQRLQRCALGRKVGVDQRADAGGQRVGQRLDEVALRGDLVRRRAE